MAVEIVDFEVRATRISGMVVITMKQVTDERGTVRELFRRSALQAAGIDLGAFDQINVTTTRLGAVRGLHAEDMTKLVAVADGSALGAYLDLRRDADTYGVVETVALEPGVQVLVPRGVANGFQALADPTHYVYCFDREWAAGMAGVACNPLDPALGIAWPLPVDADDPAQLSAKDRSAPTFAQLEETGA